MDHFNGFQRLHYNSAMTGLLPFTRMADPKNTSFSGCIAHVLNFNPQVAVIYSLGNPRSYLRRLPAVATSPRYLPRGESSVTTGLMTSIPVHSGLSVQAGVRNLLGCS